MLSNNKDFKPNFLKKVLMQQIQHLQEMNLKEKILININQKYKLKIKINH